MREFAVFIVPGAGFFFLAKSPQRFFRPNDSCQDDGIILQEGWDLSSQSFLEEGRYLPKILLPGRELHSRHYQVRNCSTRI